MSDRPGADRRAAAAGTGSGGRPGEPVSALVLGNGTARVLGVQRAVGGPQPGQPFRFGGAAGAGGTHRPLAQTASARPRLQPRRALSAARARQRRCPGRGRQRHRAGAQPAPGRRARRLRRGRSASTCSRVHVDAPAAGGAGCRDATGAMAVRAAPASPDSSTPARTDALGAVDGCLHGGPDWVGRTARQRGRRC